MARKGEDEGEGATTAKLDVAPPDPKALPPATTTTVESVPYRRLFW